ncbi:SIR2 family protein [Thermophagus sp. OGC60D27]|uniref:SIR2 family protein n=1 Tax=Thermophagus sp. OGC60D27 TaxID=3458415 RepID=UPI004037C516
MEVKDIKKVIESCHLNFLIGSGASKNFLETLKGVEEALDILDKRTGLSENQTDEKVIKLIEASIKYFYFEKCIKKNIKLLDVTDDSNETLNNYTNLLSALQTILAKRTSNLVSKQVNLFTTNMDVFLDIALEKLNYSYNDGFSGRMNTKFSTENFHNIINKVSSYYEYQSATPLFNLFKLHGSLNWKYNKEKDTIQYDNQLESTKKISETELNAADLVNCFDKNGNFLRLDEIYKEAEKKDFSKVQKKLDEFMEEYNNLIMVNPNKEKFEETTLKLSYYELLRMYSNNIEKENSVLFVTGFSFADEHIRTITLRVAKSNPTLLIIVFAYDEEAKNDIEEKLNISEHHNIIIKTKGDGNYTFAEVYNSIFKEITEGLQIPPSENKTTNTPENSAENKAEDGK